MTPPRTSRRSAQWLLVLLVLVYAALAGSYFVLRYAGQWIESDTANLTLATAAIAGEGTLVPAQRQYGLGFAYQALSTFITSVTALSLVQLQFLIYPVVAGGLSVIAFVMYRTLTGDTTAGALAALFLFLQPDFLFVIFRGSHEKVTWLATMLAMLLLAKSFRATGQLSRFSAYVGLFYLATLAISASNVFFGSSFIIAVAVSLVAGSALLQIWRRQGTGKIPQPIVARLVYIVASGMVLWFLNTFYLYRPAMRVFWDLRTAADKTAAVTLGLEPAYDPYAVVASGWVSRRAYLGLTLPTWVAALASFAVWARMGIHLLRSRGLLDHPRQLLLWLLYGGFGTQLAASTILSHAGGVSGNLQVRIFPSVMLLGFPLLAAGALRTWRGESAGLRNRALALAFVLMVVWASGASLLKMTNDPWLSQYWTFWTAPEDRAVGWAEAHLRYRSVWLGLEGVRLSAYAVGSGFGNQTGNDYDAGPVNPETRDLIVSDVDQTMSIRKLIPMPDVRGEHRVYDNGMVVQYHKRPRTPYQH